MIACSIASTPSPLSASQVAARRWSSRRSACVNAEQAAPEKLEEEAVITEPVPSLVQTDHEAVATLELLEHLGSAARSHQCVGKGAADTVEDRRADQELAGPGRELVEDLGCEVVGDRSLVARDARDLAARVLRAAQGHGGQRERGGPALGALDERLDVARGERQTMADDQLPGLIGGERQVGGANLGKLTRDPHARQWQTRVMAGRDHHPERGRRDAQELRDAVEDARVPDLVKLVEHEDCRLVVIRERAGDQHREISGDHRERRHHDRLEPCRRAGIACRERGQDRAPEVRRSVVVGVERDPRETGWRVAALDPRGEQGGLACTRRSRDERQAAALHGGPEPLEKPLPANRAMPERGQPELRARNIEPSTLYRSRVSRDKATRDGRGRDASRHAGASVASSAAHLNADHWHVRYVHTPTLWGGAHHRRGRSDLGRDPSDLDQLETDRLDAVEQSMQGGLVLDLATQHRTAWLHVRAKVLEVLE